MPEMSKIQPQCKSMPNQVLDPRQNSAQRNPVRKNDEDVGSELFVDTVTTEKEDDESAY